MSFNKKFAEVLAEAKKAFDECNDLEDINHKRFKRGQEPITREKKVGFIDGMRTIKVCR